MTYLPPVDDLAFALATVPGGPELHKAFPDLDADMTRAVLEAAGELCANVLAPLNRVGDQHPSRLENGQVRTPDGFAAAYKAFAEGGWTGLSADPAHGGQGLPKAMELAVFEMANAANMAFTLCPTLSTAAIEALQQHGTDRQKSLYLPKLVSGEWTGTMQLTEPQAGTDLSSIRTTAEPDGQGNWKLTGQKIFITWGDHDVADNIVGMVLARTAGAPEGIKGLSLFLCPKRLVGEDGALLEANSGVKPVSLEHKMGIHASPTCVMAFEGAHAELVGEVGQGIQNMFVMMNAARVGVGIQGVGIADRAYQAALAYAVERRQGRAVWSAEKPGVIFDHPDVRRMLMLARAKIAAARAICLSAGVAGDLGHGSSDETERAAFALRGELLTPIAKAWSTWVGVEVSDIAVQVHGGMGFIEETGVAQYYRDARIPPIYEGTNGVQANDLVGRKLAMQDGAAVKALIEELRGELEAVKASAAAALASRLEASLAACERATEWMRAQAGSPDALAGAVSYLRLMGDTLGGFLLARQAIEAGRRAGSEGADKDWAAAKAALARFYAEQVLPAGPGLADTATAGAGVLADATAHSLA